MEKLWELIKSSKEGEEYIDPELQEANIFCELCIRDNEEINEIFEAWDDVRSDIINKKGFDTLWKYVYGGDDAFYIDFVDWIIGQGEELYSEYMKDGYVAIEKYIEKYSVSDDDITHENLSYPFYKVAEMRKGKLNIII